MITPSREAWLNRNCCLIWNRFFDPFDHETCVRNRIDPVRQGTREARHSERFNWNLFIHRFGTVCKAPALDEGRAVVVLINDQSGRTADAVHALGVGGLHPGLDPA